MQLWQGRFTKAVDSRVNDFNSSIRFDRRMADQDITGSMAHAAMLTGQGILSEADGAAIQEGLSGILADLESGALSIDPAAEDIHTFVAVSYTHLDVYKRQPACPAPWPASSDSSPGRAWRRSRRFRSQPRRWPPSGPCPSPGRAPGPGRRPPGR